MAVTERLTPEYTPDQLPPMDVAGRAARLRPLIAAAGCDALVVTNLTNVRYLTGFTGSAAILLVTADIRKDYAVLLGELTQYNPELLDKERLLAITKCDMLDEDLIEEMKSHLPEGVPSVFISSISGMNIPRLKDMLWEALQK